MTFPCLTCRSQLEDSYKSCPACGNELSDFAREYSTRPVNGTYEIVGRIGRGGMGEVFRARHLVFGTDFVLKVIKSDLREKERLQERFVREALYARKVRHPNVATVADAARLPDGSLFIVSEFIDGTNLASTIGADGKLERSRSLSIARQTLGGLAAIHAAGLVHRDISPDNIMITRQPDGSEHVTIIDFGIAKQIGSEHSLTEDWTFLGKLRYASPEQLRGGPDVRLDGRSDIYSFGVVLFEMLTGRVPFSAASAGQLIALHLFTPPPPISEDLVVPELQELVHRCLAKAPQDRFQSAEEVLEAIERVAVVPTFATAAVAPAPVAKQRANRLNRIAMWAAALLVVALMAWGTRRAYETGPAPLESPPGNSSRDPSPVTPTGKPAVTVSATEESTLPGQLPDITRIDNDITTSREQADGLSDDPSVPQQSQNSGQTLADVDQNRALFEEAVRAKMEEELREQVASVGTTAVNPPPQPDPGNSTRKPNPPEPPNAFPFFGMVVPGKTTLKDMQRRGAKPCRKRSFVARIYCADFWGVTLSTDDGRIISSISELGGTVIFSQLGVSGKTCADVKANLSNRGYAVTAEPHRSDKEIETVTARSRHQRVYFDCMRDGKLLKTLLYPNN